MFFFNEKLIELFIDVIHFFLIYWYDIRGKGGRKMSQSDERLFSMLIYVLSFFTSIIGPLIIWLMKREDSELVDHHGKEYFNFVISYAIYSFVGILLLFILIGFLVLPALGIMAFVFTIIAAVKAYNGEQYRIPLTIPFFR